MAAEKLNIFICQEEIAVHEARQKTMMEPWGIVRENRKCGTIGDYFTTR